jgi:catechol 2,3-dioxygenase-like lactoylglutathione lyase family enzyme
LNNPSTSRPEAAGRERAAPADFFHVGLCVSSLDASIRFYETVAGLQVTERHISESTKFDELSNNSGTRLAVCYMRSGQFRLQLVEYLRAGGSVNEVRHNNVGSPHLSFFVDDVDAEYERLTALGWVSIASPLVTLGPTMRSFYALDPDGVPVELLQLTGPEPG